MIAKIVIGSNFSGAINYMLDKGKNAEIIDSEGVRLKDNNSIIDSFNTQLELNPNISKPVYHISLDFSAQDLNNLTNEKMKEIAQDYMKKMGISNTQYIAVRHYDKEHPHIHLCINRICNNGKLLSNKNDRYRSEKICKELTVSNGLYYASGKEKVKVDRLKEPDKSKYEIYHALKDLIPQSANWLELQSNLQQRGIGFVFKYKGNSDTIQGVIFSKNRFSFNGSSVDRNYSYSKIDYQLNRNRKEYEAYSLLPHEKPLLSIVQIDSQSMNNVSEISTIGYSSGNQENEDDFNHRKKKKKNNNLII
jgi:hypothetical protein